MRISLFCLLALGSTMPALAQTAPSTDTANIYKHQLGLTASPQLDHFFTANSSLPVGLLYKRQTRPSQLLRLGISVNQSFVTRDDLQNPPINAKYTTNNYGLSLTVGREYTRPFSQRWAGTAGLDAIIGYSHYRNDAETPRRNPITGLDPYLNKNYIQYNYLSAALAPFAGIRYQFAKRLYGSAETQILLSLLRTRATAQSVDTQLDTGQVTVGDMMDIINWNVNLRLRLINQLTVHYLF